VIQLRSMWMQDGCKDYMDSYAASDGSCIMVTWIIFQQPPLGGRPNTKPGDHGTPNAHILWWITFYQAWGPAWIKIHWNSIWLRVRSHMASHYTRGSVTTLHGFLKCLGTAFGHFCLGSHNFMVTALGSCVKWPWTSSFMETTYAPFPPDFS
jgi:hypothetical protein